MAKRGFNRQENYREKQRKKDQQQSVQKKQQNIEKAKQIELLKKSGVSTSEIKKLNNVSRETLYKNIVSEYSRKRKRKESRKQARETRIWGKRLALSDKFPDALATGVFSDSRIDKITWEDIRGDKVSREKYPWVYGISGFDYNKVMKTKNGKAFYVAYRDFTGEHDLEGLLERFEKYSNEELIDFLESIVNTPETFVKGKSASSGSAGDYRFEVGSKSFMQTFHGETYNINRRKPKKKRQHTGEFKGFQVLKSGRSNSFDEATPRRLLIVANAICYNVTESNRVTFYNDFYNYVCEEFPDMEQILPRPRY